MMVDIARFSLIVALALSGYTIVAVVLGAKLRRGELVKSGERAVIGVFATTTLASIALFGAFLGRNFSLEYVASYSERSLGTIYTISAFWAGNPGSLLLWVWLLSIFAAIVVWQNRRKNRELMPGILGILMTVSTFLLLIIVFMANPFKELGFTPADGRGLNPMLENPGMYLHPPTLYLGYVGFAIPFAFAMAALITGRLGEVWIKSTRKWTLFAWFFLSVGNMIGAWWAYYTLGWGGYWGWDPVENASFMPWLTGTAYLHSVMIQEKKRMLKTWNMVLIIITFVLTMVGTFITRSGVIQSVHSFASSGLGPYFLAFIGFVLIGSLVLLAFRLNKLGSKGELDSLLSRESTFLFNNLILLGLAFAVLWGTIFPFISEAVRGTKITVGPPFFNQVATPLFLILLLLMGICPLIAWRRASASNLRRNFLYPFVAAVAGGILIYVGGIDLVLVMITLFLVIFVATTIVLEFYRGTRARHDMSGENYFRAFFTLIGRNRRRYGGYIVHVGVVLLFFSVTGGGYKTEKIVTVDKGEAFKVRQFELEYKDLGTLNVGQTQDQEGNFVPTKQVATANLAVSNGGG
ncbi:MAG: heme lyase CcmF/NrfE family subunit, partial [Terriglobia bacterium]